jgi:hypothetical protein
VVKFMGRPSGCENYSSNCQHHCEYPYKRVEKMARHGYDVGNSGYAVFLVVEYLCMSPEGERAVMSSV